MNFVLFNDHPTPTESATRKCNTFVSHLKREGLPWRSVQSPELSFSETAAVPCAADGSGDAESPDSRETSFLKAQTVPGSRKDRV